MFAIIKETPALKHLVLPSVFINLLSLALPFTMLQIYDRILPNESFGTAIVLVIGVFIAILLELVLRYTRSWMLASYAANLELKTTVNVVDSLFNAKFEPVSKLGVGGLFNGVSSIASMREIYSGQGALALLDIPFIFIFLILVAYIGGSLVFVPIVIWGVAAAFVFFISKTFL